MDEAHNLVDRARNMYSAQIYKEDVLSVKKLVAGYSKKLAGILERCNRYMLEMKRKCDGEYMIEERNRGNAEISAFLTNRSLRREKRRI